MNPNMFFLASARRDSPTDVIQSGAGVLACRTGVADEVADDFNRVAGTVIPNHSGVDIPKDVSGHILGRSL